MVTHSSNRQRHTGQDTGLANQESVGAGVRLVIRSDRGTFSQDQTQEFQPAGFIEGLTRCRREAPRPARRDAALRGRTICISNSGSQCALPQRYGVGGCA